MQTTGFEAIYQQIADAIVAMIPENWSRVLLYAQVGEESAMVYFYYYPVGKDAPEYSLDIARKWDIQPSEFDALEKKLFCQFVDLRCDFIAQGHEPWTNLTLTLESDGRIGVDYDYTDKESSDSYEDLIKWRTKNLNMMPDAILCQDRQENGI